MRRRGNLASGWGASCGRGGRGLGDGGISGGRGGSELGGGEGRKGRARGLVKTMHGGNLSDNRPSHLYNTGTERVGFSPTRQALHTPSAKRCEVFGESHDV